MMQVNYDCLGSRVPTAEPRSKMRESRRTARRPWLWSQSRDPSTAAPRRQAEEDPSLRAAVLHNLNEPLDVTDVEIDEPHAGEVRVRMQASGVCHSDLSVIEGVIPFRLPMVAGHEGAGIVEAVRPRLTPLNERAPLLLSPVST